VQATELPYELPFVYEDIREDLKLACIIEVMNAISNETPRNLGGKKRV
jgi:hypothetical protein